MSVAFPCENITAAVIQKSTVITDAPIGEYYLFGKVRNMKSAETIRAENLERLISERANGKASVFSSLVDKDPTLISRWRPRNKNPKVISSETARKIEIALKIDSYWMDQDHTPPDSQALPVPLLLSEYRVADLMSALPENISPQVQALIQQILRKSKDGKLSENSLALLINTVTQLSSDKS